MKTNNRQGRSIALIVGVYFIAKSVLNLILGGSVLDVIIAAAEAALLYTGLMYVNYIIAVVVLLIVLKNLKNNITNFSDNWLYLIEGIVDTICAVIICFSSNVKNTSLINGPVFSAATENSRRFFLHRFDTTIRRGMI